MGPSVTPAAEQAPRERAAYDLSRTPDGTSWTSRENLTDIVERELLGPRDGDEEILDVSPEVPYLVGRIAPVQLLAPAEGTGIAAPMIDDEADDEADQIGDEDSGLQDSPLQRGLMIPASMGLRFQVPLDLDSFTVHASWGTYAPTREAREEGGDQPGARPTRPRFRRTPHDVARNIQLNELTAGQSHDVPLEDTVILRIDRYDDLAATPPRALIEVALCNDTIAAQPIPTHVWLYQTRLDVDAQGAAVFLPVRDALVETEVDGDPEQRRLELQYRDRLEFAVGRTCSVDWTVPDPSIRRATAVRTTWLPVSETPQTDARPVPGSVTDMTVLATASVEDLRRGLEPLADQYAAWLAEQRNSAAALPEHLRPDADAALYEADRVAEQLRDGIRVLLDDPEAVRCFRFMNDVMAKQRIHSQIVEKRAKEPALTIAQAHALVEADGAKAHSWRPFQLAFVLMQIPALLDPGHARRASTMATVELLFFPTGGGKTEAYLGLAAYAFAIRRRQGALDTPDGRLDGADGITVLMRYTLRLLTSQQFQRATTLICAAELARQADPTTWGEVPFRIGLWVGTDVSPKRVAEAAAELAKVNERGGHRLTVLQIQRCPWCGAPVTARNVSIDATGEGRVRVHCSDSLGGCPFGARSGGLSGAEGLPVLTTDEEIYRLTPAFLIATVDKFARLAREGEAAALFGYVGERCTRHGWVHTDSTSCTASRHNAVGTLPAAHRGPAGRLRPPDLIIQDELHLITGALGTTVGLFEVAVDALCEWTLPDGRTAGPVIVASSATVRNAHEQVKSLYGRDTTIFPPLVLDAGDSFFAVTVPVTPDKPGRRYLGICTTGVRMTAAEIRIAEVLLAAGQLLLDRDLDSTPHAADPYLTLVGYFNATRELAGMARYLADDVSTLLAKGRAWSLLPRRYGTNFGTLNIDELTSRVSSADITRTLDHLAATFSAEVDSSAGRAARGEARAAARTKGLKLSERATNPYDVVLATSMLQVGVDVTRLGLMLMVGQPKNTAEYIQASSRVGRDPSRPGLVVSLGNWSRPRDLSHFEAFRHFHETFYQQVEALSVTPFSLTSLERGLDGVLVSAARALDAPRRGDGLSPERNAGRIATEHPRVQALVDRLVQRIAVADADAAAAARGRMDSRLGEWRKRRDDVVGAGRVLSYEKPGRQRDCAPLMAGAETASDPYGEGPPFRVANSMREVQPEINVLVSPNPDRLYRRTLLDPDWVMPMPDAEEGS
ncbi:MAG: DISARM system helicase DrmA [Dermatophilaceae bacterium]|nr:DISARM system helicase DrmA [Dermatophilaceae bacterium]